MLGTFGGALDARKVHAKAGRLTCEVRGEVEDESGVLIIKRLLVTHSLCAEDPDAVRDAVLRVHDVYARTCPGGSALRKLIWECRRRPNPIAGGRGTVCSRYRCGRLHAPRCRCEQRGVA